MASKLKYPRRRAPSSWPFTAPLVAILITLAVVALWIASGGLARGEASDYPGHSNPWLLTWIPPRCCVTSDCCTEVAPSSVASLPDDHWRINASGQVLKRTDWSPDGKYYRCACGWKDNINTTSHTYCIFVPMQSSMKSGG